MSAVWKDRRANIGPNAASRHAPGSETFSVAGSSIQAELVLAAPGCRPAPGNAARCGEARDQPHRRQLQLLDLLLQRLAVIDHRVGPEIEAPFSRFRPRCGGHHRKAGEPPGELDQDRTDAAGAADDQQRPRIDALAGLSSRSNSNSQAVIDVRKSTACTNDSDFGLPAPDDALVDQVIFGIGALALDQAGALELVSGLEQRDVGADRVDHAGGVEAEDLGLARRRRGAQTHLGVDEVHRDRLHRDADVASLRLRCCGFEIDQRIRRIDGEEVLIAWLRQPFIKHVSVPCVAASLLLAEHFPGKVETGLPQKIFLFISRVF